MINQIRRNKISLKNFSIYLKICGCLLPKVCFYDIMSLKFKRREEI